MIFIDPILDTRDHLRTSDVPFSSWGGSVSTFANLPTSDAVGTIRQTLDTGFLYRYDGVSWVLYYNGSSGGSTVTTDATLTGNGSVGTPLGIALSHANTRTGKQTFNTSTVRFGANTASTVPYLDSNKDLTSSAVTPTELSYVSGVTSAIQTQLNAKQATGNYITALTGDGTASGPGSSALTLATVNSNVGSFTNASITVDAKGRITAASTGTGGSSALSALTIATATNTIDNTLYKQERQRSTLAGTDALKLSSTSTAAASNLQTLFNVALSGTNATSAQTTYAAQFSNTHAGTTSTNVGGFFTATGGTTANYAIDALAATGANNYAARFRTANSGFTFQEYTGAASYFALYPTGVTPGTTNYVFAVNSVGSDTAFNGASGQMTFSIGGAAANAKMVLTTTGVFIGGNTSPTRNLEVRNASVAGSDLALFIANGTAAASNLKTAVNIQTSGANATTTQTTYGLQVSNVSTGTLSTNVGGFFTASGAATANYAILAIGGQNVFGTTTTNTAISALTGSVLKIGIGSTSYFDFHQNNSNNEPILTMRAADFGTSGNIEMNQGLEFSSSNSVFSAITLGRFGAGYPTQHATTLPGFLSARINALTTGTSIGVAMENSTAALVGAQQQNSPAAYWKGSAWNAATPASQAVEFREYVVATPGATAVSGYLTWESQINGGGYTTGMVFTSGGNLGIGMTAPTARLHLPAGTATASTAPLKFNSGTNLTTPEAGAIEYDGSFFYGTPVATRLPFYQGINVINAQTGTTYTLVLTDIGKTVTLTNASAITLTVPTNASVAFPVGTQIDLSQDGAGKLTVAAAGGVTISSFGGNLSAAGQYVGLTLKKTGTNAWTLYGNLIA